jgi:hemoglobin/transferrin/lactoferrin receptor protein
MRFIFIQINILFFTCCYSQNVADTLKSNLLEEINLSNQRYSKSKKSPQQISTISLQDIEFQNAQTSADVLVNSGKLTVQKSQQGGGSPILRGFEASRILLLVDGVRMNNLIFRSGHLQNILNVDENMIENVDVLFGPSSTIFGSDALGGAINIQTKKPVLLSYKNNKVFSGNVGTRYSTVNQEKSGHVDFNLSGHKIASLTSFSINEFGDLKMGSKKNGKNDFFGERKFYVERINNKDVVIENANALIQVFSGYKQYNAMQKILFQPNEVSQHQLSLQFSTTTDIPRYDRLTETRENLPRFAVWNYGPQERLYAGYKFTREKAFLNSNLNLGINYQKFEESRIDRAFNKPNETNRLEKVNVYSINLDLKTKLGNGDLLYGAEVFYDDVNSTANSKNIITNVLSPTSTRYPDGKNYTLRSDIFSTYTKSINDKTLYNIGARIGYINLYSEIKDNSYFNFPSTTTSQNNLTYSGSIGIVSKIDDHFNISTNIASAFRVPNIDDLSKIFDTDNGMLIVPNPDIKPEKTLGADVNFTYSNGKAVELENVFFFTRLYDAIVTDDFELNGQNAILYNGVPTKIMANQNFNKANVLGYSTSLKILITKPLKFYGTFNYTYGRILAEEDETPLDHIPTLNGKTGISFENKSIKLDFFMLYNGKKDIKDYLLNGEDNERYAPKDGTPAWQSYNFKTAIPIIKNLTLFSGIENLLDTQYRTFSSGINAPGRNFYFGGKYTI